MTKCDPATLRFRGLKGIKIVLDHTMEEGEIRFEERLR